MAVHPDAFRAVASALADFRARDRGETAARRRSRARAKKAA
jgi:hypothetical protein